MAMTAVGRVLFALSFALSGGLCLAFPDFAAAWQPLPARIIGHDTLAKLCGFVVIAGAAGLLLPRAARPSSLVLAGVLVVQMLTIKLAHLVAHPLIEVGWEDLSESLAEIAGAWTLFAILPRAGGTAAQSGALRAGRILFALALPAIGLSHIVYLRQTAGLVPSWLPFPVLLAYLTGAAHIAAGVGILLRLRLAALLEAVMVSLFTLLVWVPMVIVGPASFANWSELCVSAAISGAAWIVAGALRGEAHRARELRA